MTGEEIGEILVDFYKRRLLPEDELLADTSFQCRTLEQGNRVHMPENR